MLLALYPRVWFWAVATGSKVCGEELDSDEQVQSDSAPLCTFKADGDPDQGRMRPPDKSQVSEPSHVAPGSEPLRSATSSAPAISMAPGGGVVLTSEALAWLTRLVVRRCPASNSISSIAIAPLRTLHVHVCQPVLEFPLHISIA